MRLSFSPIIAKDIRLLLRSRRAFWFLFALLILTSGAFVALWQRDAGTISLSTRSLFARQLFINFTLVQICVFSLISPVISSTLITSERENKTFDLLFCTGIGRFHLLLGKWASTIAYQLVLVVALLPVLALIFQLGGIGLDEYLAAAALIVAAILTYGMVGLALSCHFRKTPAALVATVWTVLTLVALIPMLIHFLHEQLRLIEVDYTGSERDFAGLLFILVSPVTTWLTQSDGLYGARINSSTIPMTITPNIVHHLFLQGGIFLVALAAAWQGLVYKEVDRARTAKKLIDDPKLLKRRKRRWPFYLVDPLRRPQAIGDRQNPMWIKENRVGAIARMHVLLRVGYVGVFLSMFLIGLAISQRPYESLSLVSLIVLSFFLLFVPILAATAITREYEENTIDLLGASLITPSQIVLGKFYVASRALIVLALCALVIPVVSHFVAIVFYSGARRAQAIFSDDVLVSFLTLLKVFPMLISFLLLHCAVGLLCSSYSRRNITAIVSHYAVIAAMTSFPFVLLLISQFIQRATRGGISTSAPLHWMSLVRPLDWIRSSLGPVLSPHYYLAPRLDAYAAHLFGDPGAWSSIAFHTLAVCALTALALRVATKRLGRELVR